MTFQRFAAFFRSTRLALALLIAIALFSAYGTFRQSSDFQSPLFLALIVLLTGNIVFCTTHRYRVSKAAWVLKGTDAIMHVSIVIMIAGGALKGAYGFVGTQNIRIGDETRSVYVWKTHTDRDLDCTLRIERLITEYYPFRARVGLTDVRSGERIGAIEVIQGRRSVEAESGIALDVLDIDRESKRASFSVSSPQGRGVISLGLEPGPGDIDRVRGRSLDTGLLPR